MKRICCQMTMKAVSCKLTSHKLLHMLLAASSLCILHTVRQSVLLTMPFGHTNTHDAVNHMQMIFQSCSELVTSMSLSSCQDQICKDVGLCSCCSLTRDIDTLTNMQQQLARPVCDLEHHWLIDGLMDWLIDFRSPVLTQAQGAWAPCRHLVVGSQLCLDLTIKHACTCINCTWRTAVTHSSRYCKVSCDSCQTVDIQSKLTLMCRWGWSVGCLELKSRHEMSAVLQQGFTA